MATESVLKTCTESLTRIQMFKASTLSREDDLGKQMSFAEAVKPAETIVAVYKRISLSSLPDFADNQLNTIHHQANADFNVFKQILDFNAAASDAVGTRSSILSHLKVRRAHLFEQVWQFVDYDVAPAPAPVQLEL